MPDLRFPVGRSRQDLVLPEDVLTYFDGLRQDASNKQEAGGQLFASIVPTEIVVQKVTGPRPSDKRGRYHYEPDRKAEQREIRAMHERELYYIGDWHTHPQPLPSPSDRDLTSINESAIKSAHGLNGFVLIVVGTAPFPQGLHVSLHSGTEHVVLKAAAREGGDTD